MFNKNKLIVMLAFILVVGLQLPVEAKSRLNTQGGGGTAICPEGQDCVLSDLFIKGLGESFVLSDAMKANLRSIQDLLAKYRIGYQHIWDEHVFGSTVEYRFVEDPKDLPCNEADYLHVEVGDKKSFVYGCTRGLVTHIARKAYAKIGSPMMQALAILHERSWAICGDQCKDGNGFLITEFIKGAAKLLSLKENQDPEALVKLSDEDLGLLQLLYKRALMINFGATSFPIEMKMDKSIQRAYPVVIWPNGGGLVDSRVKITTRDNNAEDWNPFKDVKEYELSQVWTDPDLAELKEQVINNVQIGVGSEVLHVGRLHKVSRIAAGQKLRVVDSRFEDSILSGGEYRGLVFKCVRAHESKILTKDPGKKIYLVNHNLKDVNVSNSLFGEDEERDCLSRSNFELESAHIENSEVSSLRGNGMRILNSKVKNSVLKGVHVEKQSDLSGVEILNSRVSSSKLSAVSTHTLGFSLNSYTELNDPFRTGWSHEERIKFKEVLGDIESCDLSALSVQGALFCKNSLHRSDFNYGRTMAYGNLTLEDSEIMHYFTLSIVENLKTPARDLNLLTYYDHKKRALIGPNVTFKDLKIELDWSSVGDIFRDDTWNSDLSQVSRGDTDPRFKLFMRNYNRHSVVEDVGPRDKSFLVYPYAVCDFEEAEFGDRSGLFRSDDVCEYSIN